MSQAEQIKKKVLENWEKPQWGAWKIVSDMLDNPDSFGIYKTSECYQKLYDFVMEREQVVRQEMKLRAILNYKFMSKIKKLTKCPRCGKETFVESIFGSICGACFYEPEGGFSQVDNKKAK